MKEQKVDEHGFLGEEFLTWLWWSAETRGGVHAVTDQARIGVALDRLLEFYDEATGVKVVVRGDAPTRAPEAREALARGMRLARAGLVVTVDDENVTVVLDGKTLDLRSVKGEKPEGETREDRDAAALASLFGLVDAIDRVYATFLRERAAPGFGQETGGRIIDWARSATRAARTLRRLPDAEAVEA